MASKFHHNAILTSSIDYYCLACQNYFKSEEDANTHIEDEKHAEKLVTNKYLVAYKDDRIRKVYTDYYCEYCNALLSTIAKVKIHVTEPKHFINKGIEPVKRVADGVVVFDEVIIGENSWHGLTEDICAVCNKEFTDKNTHKKELKHILNLMQSQIEFGPNKNVYRKIDNDSFQCFTCNLQLSADSINSHFTESDHKNEYENCRELKKRHDAEANIGKDVTESENNNITAALKADLKEAKTENNITEELREKINKPSKRLSNKYVNYDKKICEILGARNYIANGIGKVWCLVCDWTLENETPAMHLSREHHQRLVKIHKDRLEYLDKNEYDDPDEKTPDKDQSGIDKPKKEEKKDGSAQDESKENNSQNEQKPYENGDGKKETGNDESKPNEASQNERKIEPTQDELTNDEQILKQNEPEENNPNHNDTNQNINTEDKPKQNEKNTESGKEQPKPNETKQNAPMRDEPEEAIPDDVKEDRSRIIDGLSEFQNNDMNINLVSDVATCKKCSKTVDFDFKSIKNHVDQHKVKKEKANKKNAKPTPFMAEKEQPQEKVDSKTLFTKPVHINRKQMQEKKTEVQVATGDVAAACLNDEELLKLQIATGNVAAACLNDEELLKLQIATGNVAAACLNDEELLKLQIATGNVAAACLNDEELLKLQIATGNVAAACPNDEELLKFVKENFMIYSQKNKNVHCPSCNIKLPALMDKIKEHVDEPTHKKNLVKLHPKKEVEIYPIQRQNANEFFKSIVVVNNSITKDVVINEKFAINFMSFYSFTKKPHSGVKCELCDIRMPSKLLNEHKNSNEHIDSMSKVLFVTTMETEFVREVRSGVFHCGFCNIVKFSWEDLLQHLHTTEHDEAKTEASCRLQQHMPAINKSQSQRANEKDFIQKVLLNNMFNANH